MTTGPRNPQTYETALAALSSDLHIARTPEAIRASAVRRTRTPHDVREYLRRISLSPLDGAPHLLPRNVVHITGTKGKGSTASLCESVLRRAHGLTTGMFTSPHLVDVRERIRINGRPVSKEVFGEAYWTVRERLERWAEENKKEKGEREEEKGGSNGEEEEGSIDGDILPDLPGYFRMLTLMAFLIFAHHRTPGGKKVDAMILEVGMGGRFDATNVLDLQLKSGSPNGYNVISGVTLIDLDHTRVLGTTKAQIAWEKGGIFHVDKSEIDAIDDAHCDDERQDFITRRPSSIAEFDVHDLHDSGSSVDEAEEGMDMDADEENEKGGGCGDKTDGGAQVVGVRITPRPPTLSPASEKKDTSALLSAISGSYMPQVPPAHDCRSVFFTINSNPPEVLSILRQCARNEGHGHSLEVVRIDDSLDHDDAILPRGSTVGLPGRHQKVNAGLAVEMCRALVAGMDRPQTSGTDSDGKKGGEKLVMALAMAFWPGRCQTIVVPANPGCARVVNVRLDGAHTPQSLGTCLEWFHDVSSDRPRQHRVLVFHCGHERNPVPLLRLLQNQDNDDEAKDPCPSQSPRQRQKEKALSLFGWVYFCRPDSERPSAVSPLSASELLSDAGVTIKHATEVSVDDNGVANGQGEKTWQETLSDVWSALEQIGSDRGKDGEHAMDSSATRVVAGLTVDQAMDSIRKGLDSKTNEGDGSGESGATEVLVTGSLYVVGSALKALGWEEEAADGCLHI